jgi:hypothetical protein
MPALALNQYIRKTYEHRHEREQMETFNSSHTPTSTSINIFYPSILNALKGVGINGPEGVVKYINTFTKC